MTQWPNMTLDDWVGALAQVVSTVFLNLVKSLLAPLLFALVVSSLGRATGSIGRTGLTAVIYFEVVTSLALVLGWASMAWFEPGLSVSIAATTTQTSGATLTSALVDAVPTSIIDAMSRNAVLPMMIFFGLVGWAARAKRNSAASLLDFCDSLLAVMMSYATVVIKLAPFGMVAAVTVTLLNGGVDSVRGLTSFVIAALAAQFGMIAVYFLILLGIRTPIGAFLRHTRNAIVIAMTTTSSAAALPKALEGMERLGLERSRLGLVMPMGLSLNLAGSTIQLMMGVLFAAQAARIQLDFGQLVMIFLTLKIAAKGVAGIPRANFVILSATLPTFGLPLDSLPLLLAVDGIIDMVRTPVNVLGNCVAPLVVEKLTEQPGQR
ncbi:MAG: dicarboxylate/amino acid:cation symporter [Acidobacteria bacterium]|nr:dicarboxylate/amino acid:cation symporter [Acidobacteriota bacterium]